MIDVEIACVSIGVCGSLLVVVGENAGALRLPSLRLDGAQNNESHTLPAIAKEIVRKSGNTADSARIIDVLYDGKLMTVGYLMENFRQIRRTQNGTAWVTFNDWRTNVVPDAHRGLVSVARMLWKDEKYAMCS